MEDEHAHIMKHSDNLKFEEEEEEQQEDEEALSLSDLPLNRNSAGKCNSFDDKSSGDFFEFFNGFSSYDMCPADDIILCGRLVPFKDKDQSLPTPTDQPKKLYLVKEAKKSPAHRRRSGSLSSSVTRSSSDSTCSSSRRVMMRNSRSLDYRRLRESSSSGSSVISPVPEMDRNCSARSAVQSEIVVKKAIMKPRWYSLMFGTMKAPPEMELSDIKSRQVRRNPSTSMFPTTDAGTKPAKVSWRILKALSCKDHTSVAVTTSYAMPQAS